LKFSTVNRNVRNVFFNTTLKTAWKLSIHATLHIKKFPRGKAAELSPVDRLEREQSRGFTDALISGLSDAVVSLLFYFKRILAHIAQIVLTIFHVLTNWNFI
jgi:hypothetical protein